MVNVNCWQQIPIRLYFLSAAFGLYFILMQLCQLCSAVQSVLAIFSILRRFFSIYYLKCSKCHFFYSISLLPLYFHSAYHFYSILYFSESLTLMDYLETESKSSFFDFQLIKDSLEQKVI